LRLRQETQVNIYDISQPDAPQAAGSLTLPANSGTMGLAAAGDMLYTITSESTEPSLIAINVADPQNPSLFRRWPLPFGVRFLLSAGDGNLFLISSEQEVWLLNVSDPADPQLEGQFQPAGGFPRITQVGNQLFVASQDAGLYRVEMNR
jgi:hypothetical protein